MFGFGSAGVTYTAKDIPSLRGKVLLVTGGNSGLGKQSVLDLARREPHEIWLTARTLDKANEAIRDIQTSVPAANIKPLAMDLASLASVRDGARAFLAHAARLDVLLLNAGCMSPPPGLTTDGYEVHFGTNHLGHALLTKLLAPLLAKTAAAAADADVRVVVLSSMAAAYVPEGGIVFDTLKTPQSALSAMFARYGQSKLANALFARQLAKQFPTWTVAAVHPGGVQTNLLHHGLASYWFAKPFVPLMNLFLATVEQGAQNQLWAATAPRKDIKTGAFYFPVADLTGAAGAKYVADDDLAKRLWDWTEHELSPWTE